MVNPEHMSLTAHRHVKNYLTLNGSTTLSENDLTAVLRLSQHLRIFGLLSATGYVNQSNNQQSEIRQRTAPVWTSLLGQFLNPENPPDCGSLMQAVITLANEQPNQYLKLWRQSLVLANHWNFWARAYKEK